MKILLKDVTKKYGDLLVLDKINLEFLYPGCYCLLGPSGSGKTTLLRILMGLEAPDTGQVKNLETKKIRAAFQEDRLCESFSAIENIFLACDNLYSYDEIVNALLRILPLESVSRPVSTLSGGMKRRVAILRALLAPSQIVIMDEPFSGLDPDTKMSVIQYIKELTKEKLLIFSTHQEEDIHFLQATPIWLPFSKQ